MFFLILGAVSASEINNVTNTDGLDLNVNDDKLSLDNFEENNSNNDLLESQYNSSNDQENNVLTSNVEDISQKLTADTAVNSNITQKTTTLTITNAHYSKSSTEIKVILKDGDGKYVANKTVTLKVNGKTYTATTTDNGGAYFTTTSLAIGKYTATAQFKGDDEYSKSSVTQKFSVLSSISKHSNMVKYCGDPIEFSATFIKDNTKLANTKVTFTINGKKYEQTTDSNGVAKVTINNLKAGKYIIKIYNPYSKETVSNTITVKKGSVKLTGSSVYVLPKTKYSYSVVLKNSKNKVLNNIKVYFKYNNKKATAKTNSDGKATITIPALSKGTYTITYKFGGNWKYKASSASKKLYVRPSTTTLKSTTLKMQYNDGSEYSLTATNSAGKALTNKNIKFTLNGKTTTATTNSKGVAKLKIGALKPNTYTVKSTYSTAGKKEYNINSGKVIISKQSVAITAKDLVMKHNDGSSYQVTIKNKTGTPLKGMTVQFTLNGKTTKADTDSNGVAKMKITENIGYYPIYTKIVDTNYYTSSKVTKHVLVNGTKFSASDMTVAINSGTQYSVKLIDAQNKAVSGATVKFTLNNKVQSVKTDANGIAKLSLSGLTKGTYTVSYTDGFASGTSKITVLDKVTLKQVITSSQNVKKYIENNGELPNTVKIGDITYSLADYMYLASQAIINLKANNKGDIAVKLVSAPKSPKAASNLGNLYDYLSVAKSVVSTANSKGIMPDSVSSKVGTIGYNGLVYAFARTVAYYGDYSAMPNYVTIKTYSTSTSSSLNSKNTITNLAAYLKASTNCQVGNSKIKSLVNSLTSGLTTDLAKAKAIYNYVRDSISYSFYYDTKYGAVGTLNAKTGNCVDQAHLLIAMYRTAGLAARYVHGTCTFSSGTYGHVWTQVLIGDTWIVSDPTSTRNSFGNVVNWNNNHYSLKGYYSSISF